MSIRIQYDHDLVELQRRLSMLSEQVDRAIASAVWALIHQDVSMAQRVVREDATIDELRYDLEEAALLLMALQQPIAGDLRMISAVMGLASELERIGDYAEGIAAIVLRGPDQLKDNVPSSFGEMAQKARNMLTIATRAIMERDAGAVTRLDRADDEVDQMYSQIVQEQLVIMREQPERSEVATYMVWAAHNLERIADRTVNIAERASFIATGILAPVRPEHGLIPS